MKTIKITKEMVSKLTPNQKEILSQVELDYELGEISTNKFNHILNEVYINGYGKVKEKSWEDWDDYDEVYHYLYDIWVKYGAYDAKKYSYELLQNREKYQLNILIKELKENLDIEDIKEDWDTYRQMIKVTQEVRDWVYPKKEINE